MTRARKVCSHVGPDGSCPNLQPCELHAPKPWASSTRSSRLPRGWDKLRRYILDRDPVCKACENALSAECDHIVPGDDHSHENLQGLCVRCHREKSQREAQQARGVRSAS